MRLSHLERVFAGPSTRGASVVFDVSADAAIDALLEGLNPPQRDAVTTGEGPLLILAGAGSGKTRVLTHRVAYLLRTGQAKPSEILAITFTNKAASEMRERVELLVGRATRAMWVMTFHAACARMLRSDAHRLGYTRQFTIYDSADQRRLIKKCLDDLDVDVKRFTPRAMQTQISDAKNKLRSPEDYRQLVGSFFEQTVADVYEQYERELHRANAMDFDDLLVRSVNLLELFQEVRDRYSTAFRWVMVDEYQDTNHVQYRWLQLITSEHRNLAVVGDDAQCLVAGTQITMGDGSTKPIEAVETGDEVLSAYGSGDFRPARVTDTFASARSMGVEITTKSGRRIVSTPEHTHFAGYHGDHTPQQHLTYLMWRRDKGFRVGTTRTRPAGQHPQAHGLQIRSAQEHADAAWVLSAHDTEAQARAAEQLYALKYGIPTLPFVARPGGSVNGLVHDQSLIDQVFGGIDSYAHGRRLLREEHLDFEAPHHVPLSFEGRRRNVTLTLCGDRRGRRPMHVVAVGGRDEDARARLVSAGFNVRPAKRGSASWRYESCFSDFGRAVETVNRIRTAIPASIRPVARLGSKSLAFMPAASVRPGMVMFGADGEFDLVESVTRVPLDAPVYDLNVEDTHNFVANGLVTHNSIYGFRGADIKNILNFTDDYPDAHVVKLEQNYRSTQTILDAANGVISNNRGQMAKHLWTDVGEGDPVRVREMADEHAEARFVTAEVNRLVDEGVSRAEIAIFYRTNAQSRVLEDMLVRAGVGYQVIGGTKFYERAEIKDAVNYLTFLVNPQDGTAFTRIANSPRRGPRADLDVARARARRGDGDERVGGRDRRHPRDGDRGAQVARALHEHDDAPEGARRRRRARRATAPGDAGRVGLQGGARGRAHDRGPGPAREPRGARARDAGVRREQPRGQRRGVPAADRAAGGRGHDPRRRGPRDADDAAQRQGPRVPDRLHHRDGGRDVPALALDRGGQHRRGAPAGVRRPDPRDARPHAHVRAPARRVRGQHGRSDDPLALPGRDPARADRPEAADRGGLPGARARGVLVGRRCRPAPRPPTRADSVFRIGEDVIHSKLGDGVVTGIEPGGIVVVRFAGDG